MVLNGSINTQSFLFDYAVSGGAVGSYPTGLVIPKYSLVTSITLVILEAFTDPTFTVIGSLGYQSLELFPVQTNINFFASGPVSLAPVGIGLPTTIDSTNTIRTDIDMEVLFSLSVTPVTSGKVIFFFEYFESDF